jgi:hypothetical protein
MKKRERRNSKNIFAMIGKQKERLAESNNNVRRSKCLDPMAIREAITLS